MICRLQEGPRLASFVAWALPRAAGVRELTVRFTNHHQAMKFQVCLHLSLVHKSSRGRRLEVPAGSAVQWPAVMLI